MDASPPTLRPTTWTPAIRMGLSIAVATGLYGISFGALAVAAGLTVWQAMALSLLMFTGGSQFASSASSRAAARARQPWAPPRCWACATRSMACS